MIYDKLIYILVLVTLQKFAECGILFPRESKTREQKSLDGLWYFSLSANSSFASLSSQADDHDLPLMPVPSSYNDIPTTLAARDHLGEVLYSRTFRVPSSWKSGHRVWLRFGSVCYSAKVYINDLFVIQHEIGHLPFGREITSFLTDDENVIHVFVDATLSRTTIPQGYITRLSGGRKKQENSFDFFNYAGIDRPVVLYTTPLTYIDDISITTTVQGTTGIVAYNVDIGGTDAIVTYEITVFDKSKKIVAASIGASGEIKINNANLWWPYLMNDNPGYMYILKVQILNFSNELIDSYSHPFGIREIAWNDTTVTINGKPIYVRGFGRHEDSDIRGKGLDLPLIIRDHNLIKWVGANAYRTSHYPYAEEIMDLADSLGIMILDEVPAVNTEDYTDELLENHKRSLTELYRRDKNRPSVVFWSVANEPRTQFVASEDYYRHICAHIKTFDKTRPLIIANNRAFNEDHSGQFLDVLGVNKYAAWYEDVGELDTVVPKVLAQIRGWRSKYNKPVIITEYGADCLEGYHMLPNQVWSEEYQVKLMSEFFKAFDHLRAEGGFIGELIWNFADFKTSNDIKRVGGNKKGIFTRQRQPKASAHFLRKRYWNLAHNLNNVRLPADLDNYVIN